MNPDEQRLYVTVERGPAAGKTVELLAGQSLVVGRIADYGLMIPSDGYISREHCQIEFSPPNCQLTNKSSNGTLLNGKSVQTAGLCDGDEIELGSNTRLRVSFGAPPVSTAADAGSAPTRIASNRLSYSTAVCTSGLALFTSASEQPDAMRLAKKLAASRPLYAVIDFNKLGETIPEDLSSRNYLFNWMPDEVAAANSPLIVAQTETAEFYTLLEDGWGQDAIVCLYSNLEQPALVEHLCKMTRDPDDIQVDRSAEGMLGFFWPSLMSVLLPNQESSFVEELLEGIDAVLLETTDPPDGWRLYADAEFSKSLEEA